MPWKMALHGNHSVILNQGENQTHQALLPSLSSVCYSEGQATLWGRRGGVIAVHTAMGRVQLDSKTHWVGVEVQV